MPAESAKTDGRQVRWDRHNQVRRQHIIDAAIEVLGETEPGGEVHVQQIADRAGLSRTVVYRHFTDRADLDAAVQGAVLEHAAGELVPALSFEGTPVEIIRRIVGGVRRLGGGAPRAARVRAGRPPGQRSTQGPGQMERAIGHIAGQVEDLINVGVEVLHVQLEDHERAGLDPLVVRARRRGVHLRTPLAVPAGPPAHRRAARRPGDRGDLVPDRGDGPGPRRGARPRHPGRAAARGGVRRRRRVTGPDAGGVHVQPGWGSPTTSSGSGRRTGWPTSAARTSRWTGREGECPFCRIPGLGDEDGLVVRRGELATPCSTSTPTRRDT